MNRVAVYDALHCAAIAVDEAGSGRPARAMTAWLDAQTAASRAFEPRTEPALACAVVIRAAAPSREGEPWRAALWRALDTASLASLHAGDTGLADATLLDAAGLAATVPCQQALTTVLVAIWDATRDGVTA